jgi:hypothetical protein
MPLQGFYNVAGLAKKQNKASASPLSQALTITIRKKEESHDVKTPCLGSGLFCSIGFVQFPQL